MFRAGLRRDALQARLTQTAEIEVFGANVARLPGVLCFGCEGFDAERQGDGVKAWIWTA